MINISTSSILLDFPLLLKSQPSHGISLNKGTPDSDSLAVSLLRPPITVVCPLESITFVSAFFVMIVGLPATVRVKSSSSLLVRIFNLRLVLSIMLVQRVRYQTTVTQ